MKILIFRTMKSDKEKNSRVQPVLKGLSISLLVPAILFIVYIFSGTSSKDVTLNYEANIEKTTSGYLNVKMTIEDNKKPFLHLYLNDSRISKLNRISKIEVKSGGKDLPIWNTIPFTENIPILQDAQSIWTGFKKEPIEINYTVLATWDSPKNKKTRNYLNKEEGYISGGNFLLGPISFTDIRSQIQKKILKMQIGL